MAKDAVATMGAILPDDSGGRDAVHVAVFSATSAERMFPRQHVAAVPREGQSDTHVKSMGETIGIVDPFLRQPVSAGDRFWVYLYPRTITALSHRWSHPAFEATGEVYMPPATKLASEEWLKTFARTHDCPDYFELMGAAARVADGCDGSDFDKEYLHFCGRDAHGEIPPEFWDHVEVVLERKIAGHKPIYFSCSC